MPVTATLQLTEVGTTNIYSVGTASALKTNTVWADVSLRVSDVTVDGLPLDVGTRCGSAKPILLKIDSKLLFTLRRFFDRIPGNGTGRA